MCLSSPSSHAARLRSVPLVVLGFVPGSLLQGWRSPSHPLHPLAASQLWHPLPWAGGTGWMCAAQLYETAVTHEGHTHIYCQYLTLGLWCYYCWTSKKEKKKERNVSASFVDHANDLVSTLQSRRLNFTLAASPPQATSSEVDTPSGCIIREFEKEASCNH